MNYTEIIKKIVDKKIVEDKNIIGVFLFGSILTDTFNDNSDIDFYIITMGT